MKSGMARQDLLLSHARTTFDGVPTLCACGAICLVQCIPSLFTYSALPFFAILIQLPSLLNGAFRASVSAHSFCDAARGKMVTLPAAWDVLGCCWTVAWLATTPAYRHGNCRICRIKVSRRRAGRRRRAAGRAVKAANGWGVESGYDNCLRLCTKEDGTTRRG